MKPNASEVSCCSFWGCSHPHAARASCKCAVYITPCQQHRSQSERGTYNIGLDQLPSSEHIDPQSYKSRESSPRLVVEYWV